MAHVWSQLAHVTVMIVQLLTSRLHPSWLHFGQRMGNGLPVLGMRGDDLTWSNGFDKLQALLRLKTQSSTHLPFS